VTAIAALWLVAGVFGVLFSAGMVLHGRALRAPDTVAQPARRWPTILQVQFAGSGQKMATLLDRLGDDGRRALKKATTRFDDLVIIPGYTGLLLALSLLCAAAIRQSAPGPVRAVGLGVCALAGLLAVVTACLDYLENRALMRVLSTPWREILIPPTPNTSEAADRQARRRGQVASIDGASRAVTRFATRKLGCLAGAADSLFIAAVIASAVAHHR